jgi:hypothetical protein
MSLKHIMLLSAGLLLVPAPAFAEEKAKAPETAAAPKLICKKESEVGSLVRKKRVCKTAEEWERLSQASRDAMNQGQMSGSSSGQ